MANIIVSSTYRIAPPEIDGRRWVYEAHVDVAGEAHAVTYLAAADTDLAAGLVRHASEIGAALQASEISRNMEMVRSAGSAAAFMFTFDYSQPADNIAHFRAAFADCSPAESLMTGDFLNSQTDAQLEQVFGLTADQVAALRNLQSLASQVGIMDVVVGR